MALSSDWHFFILITLFLCFCFCFCLYLYFIFLSLVTTVLPCPLELAGGLLTNHQCFDLWTTKHIKHKSNRSSIACSAIAWQSPPFCGSSNLLTKPTSFQTTRDFTRQASLISLHSQPRKFTVVTLTVRRYL